MKRFSLILFGSSITLAILATFSDRQVRATPCGAQKFHPSSTSDRDAGTYLFGLPALENPKGSIRAQDTSFHQPPHDGCR